MVDFAIAKGERTVARFGYFGPRRRSRFDLRNQIPSEVSDEPSVAVLPKDPKKPPGPNPIGFQDIKNSNTTGNGTTPDDTGDSQIVSFED